MSRNVSRILRILEIDIDVTYFPEIIGEVIRHLDVMAKDLKINVKIKLKKKGGGGNGKTIIKYLPLSP